MTPGCLQGSGAAGLVRPLAPGPGVTVRDGLGFAGERLVFSMRKDRRIISLYGGLWREPARQLTSARRLRMSIDLAAGQRYPVLVTRGRSPACNRLHVHLPRRRMAYHQIGFPRSLRHASVMPDGIL